MTDVKEEKTATKKGAKKINSNGCQCKSDTPVFEQFVMDTVKGDATLQGIYCPSCYVVQQWARVPNNMSEPVERSRKVKQAEEKQPTVEVKQEAKVIEPAPVTQTAAPAEQPAQEVKTESIEQVLAAVEPKQIYFPIASVNPVAGADDQVAFMVTKNGLPFTVKVKAKQDRVQFAVNNPGEFVGKFIELEYNEVDEKGFPTGYKMKGMKTRSELPQTA